MKPIFAPLLLFAASLQAEPVFVGIMTAPEDRTLFAIASAEKIQPRWVKLGDIVNGYVVHRYRANDETIILTKNGHELPLKLVPSRVRKGSSAVAQLKPIPAADLRPPKATPPPVRRWVKITLVRLADEQRQEMKIGPLFMQENGSMQFTQRPRTGRTLAVFVSARLTPDGPVLLISSTDDTPEVQAEEKARPIATPLNTPTEFELASGRFRATVTLEAPKGAIQPAI